MPSRHTVLGRLAAPAVLTLAAVAPGLVPAAVPTATTAAKAATAPPRPNVVFVLADDLGWSDLSTGRTNLGHPSDYNETPTLARLAEDGVAFDNAYACINCAPSRAQLLTGTYAPRPENNIYAVQDLNRGGDDTLLVGPPEGDPTGDVVLPAETTTVAETLDRAGYDTGYIGKFHVARNPQEITTIHGFDENWGGSHAGNATAYHASDGQFNNSVSPSLDEFAGDYTQQYVDENIAPYSHGVSRDQLDALVGTDKHVTDAVGDATLDFVDRHKGKPFFAWLSEYAVHSPVGNAQARSDLLAKYQAKTPGSTPAKASYAALAEGLDQTVARLVDHLETTPDPRNPGHPLADNTLVLFTSDNGGRSDLGAYNGPLKGQKGELAEGGVRVPYIAWSANPDLVRGHRVVSSPVNHTDLYPTLADLAGATLPKDVPFDGTSLRTALASEAAVHRPRFAHLPGYLVEGGRSQRPQSSVRDGRWKALYSYETQEWELYDLQQDIGETTNLAASRPDLVQRLGGELARWLDETDAPLATLREGKEPVTMTVDGTTYADGSRHHYDGRTLTIEPGEELPLVLQDS
ncbi:MAG: sulfatase [Nocardioidaceae bacterium]|nr:sulfatase [Nocardioidaceae bacterium]NUS50752.1 sulfatase [Nocardioidaceae bacterium]